MRKLLMILMLIAVMGCDEPANKGTGAWRVATPQGNPLEVKIVNAPAPDQEARIQKLEDRVEALEAHAQRRGMKY